MRGTHVLKRVFGVLIIIIAIGILNVPVYAEEEYDGGPVKVIYDYIGHYSLNYTGNTNHYDYWNSTGTSKLVSRNYKDRTDVSTSNNSSATINPTDSESTIKKAYLIWQSRAENAPTTAIRIISPTNAWKNINADPNRICRDTRTNANGEEYVGVYTMVAEVTDFVCGSSGGYGTYTVANIPVWDGVQAGETVCGGESVASWQLVVVEESPNFPLRTISLNLLSQYFYNINYAVTVHFSDASAPNGDVSAQFLNGSVDIDSDYIYDGIGYPDDYNYEYEGRLYRYLTQTRGLYKNGVSFNSRDTGTVGLRGAGAIGGTRVHLFDDYRRLNGQLTQTTMYYWKDKYMGINVFLQGVAIDVFAYDIVFDGNGADSGSMENLVCIYGRGYNLPENQYSKEHYKITSWNTKPDGSGKRYLNKGYVRNLTATQEAVTLYAQWEPNTYRISLNNAGAVTGGTSTYYEWYEIGNYSTSACKEEITKITIPAKPGYKFGGYYTEADGAGTQYVDMDGNILSDAITFKEDTVLYAYWTPAVYKITLDNRGAQTTGTTEYYEMFSVGNYETETCENEISSIAIPVKAHNTFKGYYTAVNGKGSLIIDENGNILAGCTAFIEDTTIYAHYGDTDVYKITLDGQEPTIPGTGAYYERYGIENFVKVMDAGSEVVSITERFDYTGSVQTFVAPHTGTYKLDLYGAGGESYGRWIKVRDTSDQDGDGDTKEYIDKYVENCSAGGWSSGTVDLMEGEILHIYVGGKGTETSGGYNGGGEGKLVYSSGNVAAKVGGGGGATDVRRGGTSLGDRIIVAAGGGGIIFSTTTVPDADVSEWRQTNGGNGSGMFYYSSPDLFSANNSTWGMTPNGGEYARRFLPNEENAGMGYVGLGGVDSFGTFYTSVLFEKGTAGSGAPGGGGGWYGGGTSMFDTKIYSGVLLRLIYTTGGSSYIRGVENGVIHGVSTDGTVYYPKDYDGNYIKDEAGKVIKTDSNRGNGYLTITYDTYETIEQKTTTVTVPQKTGYTFGGYFTEKEGVGTKYVDESGNILSSTTAFEEDTTLYAYWMKGLTASYKIAFDGNGADEGTVPLMKNEFNKVYMLNPNEFVKDGYAFAGWSTTPSGVVQYQDTDSVIAYAPGRLDIVGNLEEFPGNVWSKVMFDDSKETYKGIGEYKITDSYISINGRRENNVAMSTNTAMCVPIDLTNWDTLHFTGSIVKEGANAATGQVWIQKACPTALTLNTDIYGTNGSGYQVMSPAGVKPSSGTFSIDVSAYTGIHYLCVAHGHYAGTFTITEMYLSADDVVSNLPGIDDSVKEIMADRNETVTLYAQWKTGVPYTVNHYTESLEQGYELYESESKTAGAKTRVDAESLAKNIKGFTYGYTKVNDTEVETVTIPDEGGLVVNLYYTRNSYQVILEKDEGILSVEGAGTYRYEERVEVSTTVLSDYSWVEWSGPYGSLKQSYSFIMPAEDVTLIANTSKDIIYRPVYTIYLENQLATESGTMEYFEKYEVGNFADYECTTTISQIEVPKRTGYEFGGYFTEAEGAGIQYVTDEGIILSSPTTFTEDTVLYAYWTPTTYTIHFDGNGATGGSMNDMVCNYNESYQLPKNQFVKSSFGFVGWNTKPDGSGFSYMDRAHVENLCSENHGTITLYAQWASNVYIVEFDANGGTGTMENMICEFFKDYTLNANQFTKTGHSFTGWSLTPDGEAELSDQAVINNLSNVKGIVRLYAKWEPAIYTISLDHQSADKSGTTAYYEKYSVANYEDSVCTTEITTIQLPEKNGYVFNGYYAQRGGNGTQYIDADGNILASATAFLEDTILYAHWTPITYIIRFEGNGSTGGSMSDMTCEFGEEYQLTANQYTKDLYRFVNWNTQADGSGVSYANQEMVQNLADVQNAVVTLYAQWTPDTYVIHFDANGGTGTMESITVNFGVPQNLPLHEFANSNEYGVSTFLGWNIQADATDALYEDGAEVVDIPGCESGSVTLYAIWDSCPWIVAEDLYYSLYEAQNGYITYEELMNQAIAFDLEDGSPVLPGIDEEKGTSFALIDYLPSDFTQFTASGSVTETFKVIDSAGNTFKKMITVHIVDTTAVVVQPAGTTRFISEKYYNESYEYGGLESDSIWKTNPEYVAAIQKAFENIKNGTPLMRFSFTYEEILQMKEFIRTNGFGNTKYPDALQRFYEAFMVPNTVD